MTCNIHQTIYCELFIANNTNVKGALILKLRLFTRSPEFTVNVGRMFQRVVCGLNILFVVDDNNCISNNHNNLIKNNKIK